MLIIWSEEYPISEIWEIEIIIVGKEIRPWGDSIRIDPSHENSPIFRAISNKDKDFSDNG